MRKPWEYENPSCASVGREFFFPEKSSVSDEIIYSFESEETRLAKSICGSCSHLKECRQWGLEHERHGIWGGLTEGERLPIRRRNNIIVEEVGVADFATGVGYSPHESNPAS